MIGEGGKERCLRIVLQFREIAPDVAQLISTEISQCGGDLVYELFNAVQQVMVELFEQVACAVGIVLHRRGVVLGQTGQRLAQRLAVQIGNRCQRDRAQRRLRAIPCDAGELALRRLKTGRFAEEALPL
ncbi:MAG: hypothetical protein JXA21_27380 [Anaerolineae bacterium]|nr:hypothetical protein [Anaerolineae bacterium]